MSSITDEEKEMCSVIVMQCMLVDYSRKHGIPFKEAFFQFAKSPVYDMLFDYSCGLWREGPDYICDIFEKWLNKEKLF